MVTCYLKIIPHHITYNVLSISLSSFGLDLASRLFQINSNKMRLTVPNLLTIYEVAEYLGLKDVQLAYELIDRNTLKAIKISDEYYVVQRKELERFIKENKLDTAEPESECIEEKDEQ